jgi:AcrR family transcriptional regulator
MNRFGATGFDRTRLDDIAADAGVTKPILYRHFGSKKDLYLAVLARHREDLPGFLEDLPAEPSLESLTRSILDRWLAYAFDNQQRWRMLFRDQGGGEEIISHGLAALVLWWSEHPDVPRATMVDVATRAVAGLGPT